MLRKSFLSRSSSSSVAAASTTDAGALSKKKLSRPMITEQRREKLSSMYSLVGTHSAVKLCRWQKADLRGYAGCYKFSCYGIQSSRCMEASPNLGCANRCHFCWRGHIHPLVQDKNPVPEGLTETAAATNSSGSGCGPATAGGGGGGGDTSAAAAVGAEGLIEWNFHTDEPVELVGKLVDEHKRLVWSNRGLPGVTKDRLDLAMQPAHCALSLVGEPISYPRINEFCAELHRRHVSTFLVNNGQFPSHLRRLAPVTQLYLSIDATTPDMMQRLDRPVHKDFWQRHEASIAILAERKERTVFRMTCIDERENGIGNMSDADIERLVLQVRRAGEKLGFIELKAMTPAFNLNKTTPLRISNVPKWLRIREFALKLQDALRGEGFLIPVVHEHSTCILLARKKLFLDEEQQQQQQQDGRGGGPTWKTWIDFDKFIRLVADDPEAKTWTFMDYRAPTPDWALLPEPGNIPAEKSEGWRRLDDANSTVVVDGGLGAHPDHVRPMKGKMKKARGIE